jgi:hypothetical protein
MKLDNAGKCAWHEPKLTIFLFSRYHQLVTPTTCLSLPSTSFHPAQDQHRPAHPLAILTSSILPIVATAVVQNPDNSLTYLRTMDVNTKTNPYAQLSKTHQVLTCDTFVRLQL